MKIKIFFTAIMLLASSYLFSQSYNKLIEPNKNWQVLTIDATQNCGVSYGSEFYFSGDTALNGFTYKKLNGYYMLPANGGSIFCPPIVVDNSNTFFTGQLLREDTIAKKVFTRDFSGADALLFDYSLNVGDTLSNYSTYSCGTLNIIVDSIRPYTLGNSTITRIFYLNNFDFYIEGVGGSRGLFEGFCFPNNDFILCVTKDNLQYYSQNFGSFLGCAGTVGFSSSYFQHFEVTTIGSTLYLKHIPLNSGSITYIVYNALGGVICLGSVFDNRIVLKNSLEPGSYYVKIAGDNGEAISKAIVVTK